ncbi:hypothetical protein H17ap60334_10410 [Thermosipho africanus H17ap60334]|jgi:hypothetical protein|uniref:DUF503 domain-containing protein n=1 Tax=Thermosipho africanus (strain TCF52B) TaxID=484019 RepID=B7IFU0_THEAB|nr:DUF503 domain-containing protein [Thermosipho africanus]ACJ74954.1 conserved hypothetical protein [Thermosipho africanus TCF52B]EKF48688.1 hypothetical protein H17ap60334_10410 [Thermosipho africanus H17ap60334]RDI92538.1 hypothetical protein Ob7_00560 [Thermosipho africanus Ob7]
MSASYLEITLRIFGIKSLKEKRSIVKRLINDLRSNFNISVVEIADQDSKDFITLGISLVSINKSHAYKSIESIVEYIERYYTVENVYKEVYD